MKIFEDNLWKILIKLCQDSRKTRKYLSNYISTGCILWLHFSNVNLTTFISLDRSFSHSSPFSQFFLRLNTQMKYFSVSVQIILLSTFFGRIIATPIANVWLSPVGSLTPLRQYHIQDGSGGYHYSFTGPHHAKSESSLNGITQGGKSSKLSI